MYLPCHVCHVWLFICSRQIWCMCRGGGGICRPLVVGRGCEGCRGGREFSEPYRVFSWIANVLVVSQYEGVWFMHLCIGVSIISSWR